MISRYDIILKLGQDLFTEEQLKLAEEFYQLPKLNLTNDLPSEMEVRNPYNSSTVTTSDNIVMAPFYG